jgi:hypothetical protein
MSLNIIDLGIPRLRVVHSRVTLRSLKKQHPKMRFSDLSGAIHARRRGLPSPRIRGRCRRRDAGEGAEHAEVGGIGGEEGLDASLSVGCRQERVQQPLSLQEER